MNNSYYDAPASAPNTLLLNKEDKEYPRALHELNDPPPKIWVRGTLAVAEPPAVAIVGTRNATPYGLRITKMLAESCARAGICVVSGLARGIDAAAHSAALSAGGRTVAVLGTGVNCYYPRTHRQLQETVAAEGLLISEHPPESTGHGGAFPKRNRIIAALASVVVVVEAGARSGALITVNHAQELGRTVAAVPGPIDSPASAGSNAILIHALPIVSAQTLLELFEVDTSAPLVPTLDDDSAICWDAIKQGANTPSQIAHATTLSIRDCALAISALEIDGLVYIDATGKVYPNAALV